MKLPCLLLTIAIAAITMLSSAVRAFSSRSSAAVVRLSSASFVGRAAVTTTTFRPMSSGGEPDTSVVETCRQKIQDALETKDVKVTGTQTVIC